MEKEEKKYTPKDSPFLASTTSVSKSFHIPISKASQFTAPKASHLQHQKLLLFIFSFFFHFLFSFLFIFFIFSFLFLSPFWLKRDKNPVKKIRNRKVGGKQTQKNQSFLFVKSFKIFHKITSTKIRKLFFVVN